MVSNNSLIETVEEAASKLASQPLLRKINGSCLVVGDLHGDFSSFNRVLNLYNEYSPDNLVFLGDYVDRGPGQIEVIDGIVSLITSDAKVTALRGNHEDPSICGRYGFLDQLEQHKIPQAPFENLFRNLPLAAYSDEVFFCHGGVPVHEFDIQAINDLPRDIVIKESLAYEILWNDPIREEEDLDLDYDYSMRGTGAFLFGRPAMDGFLSKHQLKAVIRAHEYIKEGYNRAIDDRCITVFSSSAKPYDFVERKYLYMTDFEHIQVLE